ncbi:response regulator [uncultured Desulfobacter sp.]|uniref:response regulator n=1 Tax=uncultured Desulfobacter sp. TaxID=240139 RepID=UPI0029F4FFC0|nr:response regulator [uncultured Desulfobacter sp.]
MAKKKILVVEDNVYNMKLVRSLIKLGGYDILEAESAEDGLALLEDNKPDLILMDIQLPGMDGLSATRQIKAIEEMKDIPVLALTAYAMKGDKKRVIEAGCAGYITKPIDTREFMNIIEGYIPGSPPEIPKSQAYSHNEENQPPIEEVTFFKHNILIVDDDPLNVKLLKAKLTSDAFSTIEAYNGQECLDIVGKDPPDIILLDLMMPGIDGFEVTKILKANEKTKSIPIIHITALDSHEDKAKALAVGADEFLNKPINTKELMMRVRSLLRLRNYQQQLNTRKQSEMHFITQDVIKDNGFEDIKAKCTILVADTNEKDVAFLQENLQPYCSEILVTDSGKDAIALSETKHIDIVLLDIPLSDINGHEVCKQLKQMDKTRNIQVITVTSQVDLESKIKSIEYGTDDYLVKPVNKLELQARIKSSIKKKAYLDILVSKYETAFNTSITDQLTGLYNNAFFKHYVHLELHRCLEQKQYMALMMIDIDNFKQVNDTFGHQTGDRVLKAVADTIRANVREIDVCARYGGEEFVVVLPYADQCNGAGIAERIRTAVEEKKDDYGVPGGLGHITVSIGLAVCPSDAQQVTELVRCADMAMYEAKHRGKNQTVYTKQQVNT